MHSGNIGLSQSLETVDAAAHLRDLPDLVLVFQARASRRPRCSASRGERRADQRELPAVPAEGAAGRVVRGRRRASSCRCSAGWPATSCRASCTAFSRPAARTSPRWRGLRGRADCGARGLRPRRRPGDSDGLAARIRVSIGTATARQMGARAREVGLRFDRTPALPRTTRWRAVCLRIAMKRAFDVPVGHRPDRLGAAVVAVPAAIKLEDGGPIFFTGARRPGRPGLPRAQVPLDDPDAEAHRSGAGDRSTIRGSRASAAAARDGDGRTAAARGTSSSAT